MKRAILRVNTVLILLLTFFVNPLFVENVEADYMKVAAPGQITQNVVFTVELEILAKAETSYSIKARLGQNTGQMTKAQTLDSSTGIWLSDSVNWDRFPKFQTDPEGRWAGEIKVRSNQTASLGQNLLSVRIKNNSDGSTKDSEAYQVLLVESEPLPESPKLELKGEPILNEFVPSPTDAQEWVEIKNKGAGKIDLGGWFIDDEEGKSSPFEIPANTILEPNGFYVAQFASAKLNDVTDSVRLLRPDYSVVEEYRYNSPERGKSFAKDSTGNWFISAEVTPGTNNPNPPGISPDSTTTQTKETAVLGTTTEKNSRNKEATVLPRLTSTDSAKVATVSASFKNSDTKNGFAGKIPFILGGFLILAAAVILGKNIYRNFKTTSEVVNPINNQ